MKKICLSVFALATFGFAAKAQLSNGGLPQSMLSVLKEPGYVPTFVYDLPDWNSFIKNSTREENIGLAKPYQVALPVNIDISFPSDGTFVNNIDGSKIWRTQVKVEDAPAIGLYYDNFSLPEGVKMFLSNENQNQILGAYTSSNNTEDNLFANEPTLGGIVNIELNISAVTKIEDIKLHINRALVYFRSYEYLLKYEKDENGTAAKPTDPDEFHIEGSSSTCEINAICPLGANYPKQRKSTVQILHPAGFFCSATMVNNTGNNTTICKHYLLTATHCEPSNAIGGPVFSQMLVRFNFEKTTCGAGPAATVNTLQGVSFRARANYNEVTPPSINGDFLLVEVTKPIPSSWDIYQAGWNRATSMPSNLVYPKRYIGFHHPAGDVKKVSTYRNLNPNGQAGGSAGPGTHWAITTIDSGGIEGGSSGSGLFDGDGRLIGIASVAGNPNPACKFNAHGDTTDFYRFVNYAKFSLAWDYSLDGVANNRMLKPWLDPTNSGVMTLNAIKSDCSDYTEPTAITNNQPGLESSINIYPNPTNTGVITARINFAAPADVEVEVFNIAGAKQSTFHLNNVMNGAYSFDLSAYANGMYLIRFSSGDNFTTKKVMLSK